MPKLTEKLKNELIEHAVKINDSISFTDVSKTEFYITDALTIDIHAVTKDSVMLKIHISDLLDFGTHEIPVGGSITLDGVKIISTCNWEG